MQLVSLEIIKSTTEEVIRRIDFNERGLSLIVDETNNGNSGSNIGKTTAVKIIDLCLGAKSISSLYKEKDTGENIIVGEFLEENRIVAVLTCFIDDNKHTFKRALYKNGKNEIDGNVKKNLTEYKSELNKLIFNNSDNQPQLRQLITKFIRLDNSNESSLLRFLGTYSKNYVYQAVYAYLFGIGRIKSENVNIIADNEKIDKDIETIYRKNAVSSLTEFETKINLMQEAVAKFKKDYSEITIVDDYEKKTEENQILLANIQKLEADFTRSKLRYDLMQTKIQKEKRKIFSVDTKLLRQLYEETNISLDQQLCDFEDLKLFHNGMVNKRIEMLEEALRGVDKEIREISIELQEKRKKYESKFVSFNVELKDRFEEKYKDFAENKLKLDGYTNDFGYIKDLLEKKEMNLKKKSDEFVDSAYEKGVKECLNYFFKKLTNIIIGSTYALIFNEGEADFPVKIIGMNGKPGAGIKKAMIACFDMAHVDLIIEKKYHIPTFIIHDKMENIDLKELAGIIKASRLFRGQYIFPILSDRIDDLGIEESEVVLTLSTKHKFFDI